MRSEGPPLIPIFRSRNQADLLTLLLLHPDRDFTLSDLSRQFGVASSTLHLEVQRLLDADLLTARQVGRSKLLRANTANRVVTPLTELLTLTFGPHAVIPEEFSGVPGVDLVIVFGSWASRYEGVPGPPPNDIDVLVVGKPKRGQVYDAADRAQQRLRFPVNPVIRSPQHWSAADDALTEQIQANPYVVVYEATGPDRLAE